MTLEQSTNPLQFTADRAAADGRVGFILGLGRALHQAGYTTYPMEDLLGSIANRLGVVGQFFATPTSIFASFGSDDRQRTFMLRTEPRPPDLGHLVQVVEVAKAVHAGTMSPRDGSARLVELEHRPLTKPLTTLVGYTLASGAAARFLGGGLAEILAAAAIGLVIGALAVLAERGARIGLLFEPISAFVCATIVSLAGVRVGGFSVPIATLAGLIVLMPGLTVTTAISELARQHLTAGTTRMAGAFMTFIGIAVGVALGYRIGGLAGTPVTVTPVPLAGWTAWVALIPASVAFAMLLKAERRDWPWIIGAGFVAVLASRAGTAMLGADLGVFVGAFVVGIYATLYQRHFLRPTPVTLVPGLMILVPGSVGFRGILALLDAQVISGINAGFNMLFTAAALVAGLLGAAAILRERGLSGEPTG